jgi:cysteine desulfurase/selenocysteine lyase
MNNPQPLTRDSVAPDFDIEKVRNDFPILARQVHGKPLIYFDTAASAQRPQAVIDAVADFYRRHNANVHRGVHTLSQEATDAYEGARSALANFINAPSERELIFTRGTTESINLVAQSYLRPQVGPGDEILITHMEHHSNIVPWQMVCEQTGATLKVAPINQKGELEMDALAAMLSERVKLIGIVQISNALGTINPVAEVCRLAGQFGIPVLVDSKSCPHGRAGVK